MKLNLKEITAEKLPAKKELFICANGKFYINDEGMVTFTYNRTPDKERVRELQNSIEQLQAWAETIDTIEEARDLNRAIRNLEKQLEFELKQERTSQYYCFLDSAQEVRDFQGCCKTANDDSVWSCAYATGLRFEENATEANIDEQLVDWRDAIDRLGKEHKSFPWHRENKKS